MWEPFQKELEAQDIDDLVYMAGMIRAELKKRGASSAWRAVERP